MIDCSFSWCRFYLLILCFPKHNKIKRCFLWMEIIYSVFWNPCYFSMKWFLTLKGRWKIDSVNFISWAVVALATTSTAGTEKWSPKKNNKWVSFKKKLVILKLITKSAPQKEQRPDYFLEHTVHTHLALWNQRNGLFFSI